MQNGGSYVLAEDIALTGGYCDIMEDMVLALNGHTLSVAEEEEPTTNEMPAEPSGQTPDIWVWLIPVAVIVIAAVAVIVLRGRKKAE